MSYKEDTRMGHIQSERLPKSKVASSDDRFMFEIVHVLCFGNYCTVPCKCKLTVPRSSNFETRSSIIDPRSFRVSSFESSASSIESSASSFETKNKELFA